MSNQSVTDERIERLKSQMGQRLDGFELATLEVLTEIRDELRKANKRPLYVVVNSQEAMKDFKRLLEQVEE